MSTTTAPMNSNIFIIRHAESRSNAGLRTASPADNPITETGIKQSQELADKIIKMGLSPELIICSPYLRTKMTAEPTIKVYPDCKIAIWDEIHEFNYLNSTRCANTNQAERKPYVEKYWRDMDPNYCDGGNAESFTDFINRISTTIEKIKSLSEKNVLIFSHGQFIAMMKIYLAHPKASIFELMTLFKNADRGRTITNCEIIRLF